MIPRFNMLDTLARKLASRRHPRKGTRSRVPPTPLPTPVILSDGAKRRSEGSPYFALALAFATVAICFGFSSHDCQGQTQQLRVIILNAKNDHPIKDRTLSIHLGTGANTPDGPTDVHGVILVEADPKTTISLVTQSYAECRPKSPDPWQTKYSVEEILSKGLSLPNVCGKAHTIAKPGELIIFERPKGLMNFLAAPIAY